MTCVHSGAESLGMKAGEHKSFELTFPPDYHGKEVAGKTARFDLAVQSIAEPRLPAVDAEFAKAFGVASGSVDELRAEVKANLGTELQRKVIANVKEQVMKALRGVAQVTIPKSLVETEAQSLAARAAGELKNRGMKVEDIDLSPAALRPQAEERVAMGLILSELVRTQQLQARPEQVRQLVTEAAQSYEQPDAVVRWHYEQADRLGEFELAAVERNVVDWALQRAQVVDQPTTFAALMEPTA